MVKSERDKIVDWLEDRIGDKIVYEQMPENDYGFCYVPRSEIVKIVDALIPMIKSKFKNNI